MTPEQYTQAPEELRLREVKVDHQVLVTTLMAHRPVSNDDLSKPYDRRWNVEIDLRKLKTTTGMDVLSGQTPEKQLWDHLLPSSTVHAGFSTELPIRSTTYT